MEAREIQQQVEAVFTRLGPAEKLRGDLPVTSPLTGERTGAVATDSAETIRAMIQKSATAQTRWRIDRETRVAFLHFLANKMTEHAADLAKAVHHNSSKSVRESEAEVASTIALVANTLKAAYESLPSDVERSKECTPLGVIAIIEPFNFFSIKLWTSIPALLAGNTVVCKASENASLATILFAEVVRRAAREVNAVRTADLVPDDVFQVAVGGPEAGKTLVVDPQVAKVVVTGSIAVCEQVRASNEKLGREARALTEGGTATFVIVSDQHDGMTRQAYLTFMIGAIRKSVLPCGGQECIGARLVVVHNSVFRGFVQETRAQLDACTRGWTVANAFSKVNPSEYSPLINPRAGEHFQWALRQTVEQGGELVGG